MAKGKRRSGGGKEPRIHKPKGLPPLALFEKESREDLRGQAAIKSVLRLKGDLLTSGFRAFLEEVVEKDSQIRDYLTEAQEQADIVHAELRPGVASRWANKKLGRREGLPNRAWRLPLGRQSNFGLFLDTWLQTVNSFSRESVERREFADELMRRLAQASLDFVENLSNQIEDEVHNYEEKTGIDLSILETTALYVCQNCHQIFSIGKYKKGDCHCGKRIESLSQIKKIAIRQLNQCVRSFWEDNIWFEEGVAHGLRQHGFECQTGILILGGSGVKHEIDVLAEKAKDRQRILVECKTSRLRINHVFTLAGKMRDIGMSRGLLVSADREVNGDLERPAATNGVVIIIGVLDNDNAFAGLG